jgi:hypothetical protein
LNKHFGVPLAKNVDEMPLYDIEVFLFIEDTIQREMQRKLEVKKP